ncbi:MAG: universal stress protein [Chlorobiaceae bacterium]|nr:universal stress protein [Chlorobiaceae bacterium]
MRATTSTAPKTILCPVDFSSSSERALIHVAERHADDAKLIVLHVGSPDTGDPGALLKEHLHHFSRFSDMLSDYRCDVRFSVEYGAPAKVIIEQANRHGAELIVLGSHGSNNISRLLVGSTTEAVMRQAPCQVLVLKSPPPARAGIVDGQPALAVLSNPND